MLVLDVHAVILAACSLVLGSLYTKGPAAALVSNGCADVKVEVTCVEKPGSCFWSWISGVSVGLGSGLVVGVLWGSWITFSCSWILRRLCNRREVPVALEPGPAQQRNQEAAQGPALGDNREAARQQLAFLRERRR